MENFSDFISAIEHKKNGLALTEEEIRQFAAGAAQAVLRDSPFAAGAAQAVLPDSPFAGAANGAIPDYQLAAMLMAIWLNGMDAEETARLTIAMRDSGDTAPLQFDGMTLDKHSTGGVSDGTSLVVAPLVAACGGCVPMISGRGLGFTGGTLDKLESIEGLRVDLTAEEFARQVKDVGFAIIGQTGNIAPADKKLYALRDVTSTIDSIPLIASSILSKKLVSGTKVLVLDVKTGSGAFMKDLREAVNLAETMTSICSSAGVRAMAVVSDMNQPLGTYVGNALEVEYAIRVLSGQEKGDFVELCLTLGSFMLVLGELAKDVETARKMLENALESGKGLAKFREMIKAQGGNPDVCDNPSLLPHAPVEREVRADKTGFLTKMDTTSLGLASRDLGAGRLHAEDRIDPSVGFIIPVRLGDRIEKDTLLCTIYAQAEDAAKEAEKTIRQALTIEDGAAEKPPLIHAIIETA